MNLEEVALRSYPAYFLGSLLGSMGWPRKRGLFGRGSVAGAALGGAWTAMMQALMGLGAGRPLLACQLLPHILPRKDWKTESADDFFARFDPVTNTQDANASLPWASLLPELQTLPDFIPWNDVVTQDMFDVLTARSTRALVYGIVHSVDVKRALDRDRMQSITGAPEAIKHGLNIPTGPPFPDNESYFQWAEQTVRAFEQRAGALPLPPPQLLAAGVVRIRVSRGG